MTPVVIGSATLYHGDALAIENLQADAIVSDPPYGIGYDPRRPGSRSRQPLGGTVMVKQEPRFDPIHGDDQPFDPTPFLSIADEQIWWGANHYSNRLPASPCWLVWDKRLDTGSDNFADCEMAWCSSHRPARIHRQLWRGICRQGEENVSSGVQKQHPNQKPIALMRWCMTHLSESVITVLDPFMGSGTTGIAAIESGRKFIGIEIDKTHFDTACERIDIAQRQLQMFPEVRS